MSEQFQPEPWRELHNYWLSKHVDGRPPARGDLDPVTEIPRLVAHLMMLEAVDDGYEYSVVGSEVATRAGVDMTGRRVGSGPKYANVMTEWLGALDFVKIQRIPRLLYSGFAAGITATNTVLLLPLHTPVGERTRILGGSFYQGYFDPKLTVENLSVRAVPG